MKKLIALVLSLVCVLGMVGCKETNNTILPPVGILNTYTENEDGTWQVNGLTYKYKLEIKGTIPKAVASTTFVYLSNIENITFEQAWKAAGFSSNTADYFSPDEAVLVEMKTE